MAEFLVSLFVLNINCFKTALNPSQKMLSNWVS